MRSLVTTRTGVRIGLAYEAPPAKRLSAGVAAVPRELPAQRVHLLDRLRAWLRALL